jgi:hypothetical protein
MRINAYSQELLTDDGVEVHRIVKPVQQQADTGVTYSAVRLFLHSSERLHDRPGDDDRSAITFWLPQSPQRREAIAAIFEEMAELVRAAPPETGLD